MVELGELVLGRAVGRTSADQITLFKSVGTAVHDLSLAVALIDAARAAGRGRELGELTRLKPFAAVRAAAPAASSSAHH